MQQTTAPPYAQQDPSKLAFRHVQLSHSHSLHIVFPAFSTAFGFTTTLFMTSCFHPFAALYEGIPRDICMGLYSRRIGSDGLFTKIYVVHGYVPALHTLWKSAWVYTACLEALHDWLLNFAISLQCCGCASARAGIAYLYSTCAIPASIA